MAAGSNLPRTGAGFACNLPRWPAAAVAVHDLAAGVTSAEARAWCSTGPLGCSPRVHRRLPRARGPARDALPVHPIPGPPTRCVPSANKVLPAAMIFISPRCPLRRRWDRPSLLWWLPVLLVVDSRSGPDVTTPRRDIRRRRLRPASRALAAGRTRVRCPALGQSGHRRGLSRPPAGRAATTVFLGVRR